MLNFRVRLQLAEALGQTNRWYCSQYHGRKIDDPETLLAYFIKNGGARDFAERYNQAMGAENRWYCSEFYQKEIRDPETLWNYFTTHFQSRQNKTTSPAASGQLSLAC
ncbi:MAG TPA: hypothetical protein VHD56_15720 [Tepidisphaeraceae bacterium]|nr:hypothetical protein [Tepidisphaeraceae bacterium]